ncbi:MAG TPA: hypothetical protein VGH27_07085, partial [Streptosporangiaceae bacterium]
MDAAASVVGRQFSLVDCIVSTPNDASMFVKAFFGRNPVGLDGCCWGGHDRDGPLFWRAGFYQVTEVSS